MSILQAIVLGVVQGLTEFLPVSSSGHLILVPWLFHWTALTTHPSLNKTFDVALHIGTFAGAAWYFRKDLVRYMSAWLHSIRERSVRTLDERISWLLIASSIPGALTGAIFSDVIERRLGQPWLIATWLAVFGIVLLIVDRTFAQSRDLEDMKTGDAWWMGVAQAIALSPGVSRSGVTITAGRMRSLSREAAVRFSFLMSLPIIAGAGAFSGAKLLKDGLPPHTAGAFAAGMIASAVTGFAAISLLLAYVRNHSFKVFVVYRLLAALFVAGIIISGFRPAT